MEQENILVSGNDWQAEFTPQSEIAMLFEFGGSKCHLLPLKLGKISEAYGLVKKNQYHRTVDGLRQSVNLSKVIPFGAEPNLRREMAFFANHATVSSYIELKGNLKIDNLNIDPLFLPGSWKRIGIINIPACGDSIPAPQWSELDGTEQVIYDSEVPFLICLLENSDGEIIEIGIGNDLWRWQSASSMDGASASFTVKVETDGVKIDRNVFVFKEATAMENRPWRFKWYFAWGKSDSKFDYPEKSRPFAMNSKFSTEPDKPSVFDLTAAKIADVTAVINDEGKPVAAYCLESKMIMKQLRKFIRSAAQHCSDDCLVFTGLEPHVCASASHLDRHKKASLVHWDIMSLFDFYGWASRQLDKADLTLKIMPAESSPAMLLPSIAGMAKLLNES
ncbi:MAG: hypothetical protein L3J71_15345 [Victivallaceae bacterium]|nr:hypothetical protein [Victivallaceae bacterium]